MTVPTTDDLLWQAMADPVRRAILSRLAQGPATAGEIAALFPISQPAVSRHLKVLGEAGLIRRAVDAQRRPATLDFATINQLAEFLDSLRNRRRRSFERLDAVLAEMDAPDAAPIPERSDAEHSETENLGLHSPDPMAQSKE